MLINFKNARCKLLEQKKTTLQQAISLMESQMQEFYNHAVWICDNEILAENAIEATFREIKKNVKALSQAEYLKCGLYKILKSQCELQKTYADSSHLSFKKPKYDQSEQFIANRKALRSLKCYYSEPLIMQIIGGFTISEIASYSGVSKLLTLDRLSIAREQLLMLAGQGGSSSPISSIAFSQETPKNAIIN